MRGLRNIEGCTKVEKIDLKENFRVFAASISEKTKPDQALFTKAASHPVKRMDLNIIGDVGFDDKSAWLTCRTSGGKISIVNRAKRSDYDSPTDLLAEIKAHIKEGRTTFRVAGEFKGDNPPGTLHLSDVSVVEKK